MKINIKRLIQLSLMIVLILLIANIFSAFIFGMLLTFGGNIQAVGLNKLAFDPLITIAYITLYYSINQFYHPSEKVQYPLFLFTLFLSFTVSFIQGTLYIIALYFLLRKFKLI